MSETPIDTQSPDYEQGYADGQASASKWKFIAQMWGGLGVFLFFTLLCVGKPAYDMYADHAEKHAKIEACSSAADVAACINAVKG